MVAFAGNCLGICSIVELRTPAMSVGVGGGKEGGGCHLNMRTWHAEGRRPILGLCWPSLGLCWPILRPWWPMPMRTKCCNLQHSALWDGKNPCKYQSCSPRKWLKHSYLQSFVHITIFVFWKTCKYQRFFAFIKTKHRFKKCKKCCNLQGSGPVASKKLRKYQRFGVQKWPKHRYSQCFVPSTFSWNCKNTVNTSIFCDQHAKNAIIYSVFLLGFQKHWYLQCFVHLGSKKYWYLQHFLRLCMAPANDVRTQKCCNLQHFVTSEKRKNRPKNVSKRHFFPILGPPKRSFKFYHLFSHPEPPKTWKPQQSEGF